jgi:hypothetical protein
VAPLLALLLLLLLARLRHCYRYIRCWRLLPVPPLLLLPHLLPPVIQC